jgi:hypothetical protein
VSAGIANETNGSNVQSRTHSIDARFDTSTRRSFHATDAAVDDDGDDVDDDDDDDVASAVVCVGYGTEGEIDDDVDEYDDDADDDGGSNAADVGPVRLLVAVILGGSTDVAYNIPELAVGGDGEVETVPIAIGEVGVGRRLVVLPPRPSS